MFPPHGYFSAYFQYKMYKYGRKPIVQRLYIRFMLSYQTKISSRQSVVTLYYIPARLNSKVQKILSFVKNPGY